MDDLWRLLGNGDGFKSVLIEKDEELLFLGKLAEVTVLDAETEELQPSIRLTFTEFFACSGDSSCWHVFAHPVDANIELQALNLPFLNATRGLVYQVSARTTHMVTMLPQEVFTITFNQEYCQPQPQGDPISPFALQGTG